MRKDAAKEGYLRTVGLRLLWIPNVMSLEDPEELVSKAREATAKVSARSMCKQLTPQPHSGRVRTKSTEPLIDFTLSRATVYANAPTPKGGRHPSRFGLFGAALESPRDSDRIRRNFCLPRKISTATLARVVPSVSAIWL
jgi:hypothetical protein